MTIERVTDKGRLLTIVTDQPLLFLGAGLPGAKARDGFDFWGRVDIEIDAHGAGTRNPRPMPRDHDASGDVHRQDYADDIIRLTAVTAKR